MWKKFLKIMLCIMGALLTLIVVIWCCISYTANYKKTTCDTSVSPDGEYELTLQAVGEPEWPFGSARGKLILKNNENTISETGFELRNDGGSVNERCWKVTWYETYAEVILSGKEQFDERVTLYFDGSVDMQQITEEDDDYATVEEAYAIVIGEYYSAAEEQWDSAALMDAGLNYMVAECYLDNPLENIGYVIVDLNNDGTEELLIGSRIEDDFFGKMIFDLYTLDDRGVHRLVFDSSERNRYYYAGENRFANLGAITYNESFETTLKFERGEMVDMTYTTLPADYVQMSLTPIGEWIR